MLVWSEEIDDRCRFRDERRRVLCSRGRTRGFQINAAIIRTDARNQTRQRLQAGRSLPTREPAPAAPRGDKEPLFRLLILRSVSAELLEESCRSPGGVLEEARTPPGGLFCSVLSSRDTCFFCSPTQSGHSFVCYSAFRRPERRRAVERPSGSGCKLRSQDRRANLCQVCCWLSFEQVRRTATEPRHTNRIRAAEPGWEERRSERRSGGALSKGSHANAGRRRVQASLGKHKVRAAPL